MALVKIKKTLQIDSADRDTTKYPTNGDYVVYLPRIYNNVTSLRLKGGDFNSLSQFYPNYVSGLSLWLDSADASSVIQSGGAVSSWKDKSGNNYHAVQGTSAKQPTWSNITSGISFNGTSQFLSNLNINISLGPHTIFIVQSQTSVTTSNRVFAIGSDPSADFYASGLIYGSAGGVDNSCIVYGLNAGFISELFTSTSPWPKGIYSDVYDSSIGISYLNGSQTNSITTPYNFITNSTYYYVGTGYYGGPSGYFNGTVYEVLVFSSHLSTADRQSVEGYLALKWNLQSQLPINHPYHNTNKVYTNNIFSHVYLNGQNTATINTKNDIAVPSNTYYFLMELEGLNKSDETRVGGDKSAFVDKYFAKIPSIPNSRNIISYNDKNLEENIANYTPAIESLDRLHIKTRTHAQQDGSGFIYFPNDYNLTFEIEYMDNQLDAKIGEN
jgi:hypothetical protein